MIFPVTPALFNHTHHRAAHFVTLRTLPLTEWAGDLPATGEGLRAAWGAIPLSMVEGGEPTPLLRQLAADVVRGTIVVDSLTVRLLDLLSGTLMLELRALERAGVDVDPAWRAEYALQTLQIQVWR